MVDFAKLTEQHKERRLRHKEILTLKAYNEEGEVNPDYPEILRQRDWTRLKWGQPEQIVVQGSTPESLNLLSHGWSVSIVGTREPTPFAEEIVDRLIQSLLPLKPTIVSGLCPGVDQHAHEAALSYGLPTIAVLPMVPFTRLATLGEEIMDKGGLVISEFPHTATWYDDAYTRRNRITAALSQVVFPIQAGERSGTNNCCNQAYDLGIPNWCFFPREDCARHPGRYQGMGNLVRAGKAERYNFSTASWSHFLETFLLAQAAFCIRAGRLRAADRIKALVQEMNEGENMLAAYMALSENARNTALSEEWKEVFACLR